MHVPSTQKLCFCHRITSCWHLCAEQSLFTEQEYFAQSKSYLALKQVLYMNTLLVESFGVQTFEISRMFWLFAKVYSREIVVFRSLAKGYTQEIFPIF